MGKTHELSQELNLNMCVKYNKIDSTSQLNKWYKKNLPMFSWGPFSWQPGFIGSPPFNTNMHHGEISDPNCSEEDNASQVLYYSYI